MPILFFFLCTSLCGAAVIWLGPILGLTALGQLFELASWGLVAELLGQDFVNKSPELVRLTQAGFSAVAYFFPGALVHFVMRKSSPQNRNLFSLGWLILLLFLQVGYFPVKDVSTLIFA